MEADSVLIIRGKVAHLNGVPAGDDIRWPQWDDLILERLDSCGHLAIIDHQVGNGKRLRVDKKIRIVFWLLFQIKVDDRVSEIVVALSERQLPIVLDLLDQAATLISLLF